MQAGNDQKIYKSECTLNCISSLISAIDQFLEHKLSAEMLSFEDPFFNGHYPFIFKIDYDRQIWHFQFQSEPEDAIAQCSLSRSELCAFRDRLYEDYDRINKEDFGKTNLYTFSFSNKEFDWCYCAKELYKNIATRSIGQCIRGIYVSAENYVAPLSIQKNDVCYYLNSHILLQFDDILLRLEIASEGLFKYQFYSDGEYTISSPCFKRISDPKNEFCNVERGYGQLEEYRGKVIQNVELALIDDYPYIAQGFDTSRLSMPIELPSALYFVFSDGQALILRGGLDDFTIEIQEKNR